MVPASVDTLCVLQLSAEELDTLERERAAQRMELYLEHERFQTEQRQRHLARQSRKARALRHEACSWQCIALPCKPGQLWTLLTVAPAGTMPCAMRVAKAIW